MKLKCSLQILEKYSNIKFNKNPSSDNRVVAYGQADGWTDKHEEANNRCSQFFDSA
jgi:hypothetical protein